MPRMDIRDWFPGHEALARLNARHPWSHNEYFHGWILRNLPARRGVAVDIGCGAGVLAGKLATCFTHVTGIDADEGMVAAASTRMADVQGASIRRCGFDEFVSTAGDGGADLITMVAVLHWLDLDDALARIPALLAPGGRLLVVGLARPQSLADLAFDVVSGAANPVMGMIKHPRRALPSPRGPDGQPVMPVKDPGTTFAEIRTAARAHLPGVAVRRRVFFRYTLRWDKPQESQDAPEDLSPEDLSRASGLAVVQDGFGDGHEARVVGAVRAMPPRPFHLPQAEMAQVHRGPRQAAELQCAFPQRIPGLLEVVGVEQQGRDVKAAVALQATVERDVPVDNAAETPSDMENVRGVHVKVRHIPRPGPVLAVAPGQHLQAVEQRSRAGSLAHGGVQAVAVPAGFDCFEQPRRPRRLGQIARVALQLDGCQQAGEQRSEQRWWGRQARSGVQGLTRQPSLEREDGAACFPGADVLGRRVASLAQAADQPDQSPLVVNAPRRQLDDELVIADGNRKGRTGFAVKRLSHDQNAVDASKSRHRVQELSIRLS